MYVQGWRHIIIKNIENAFSFEYYDALLEREIFKKLKLKTFVGYIEKSKLIFLMFVYLEVFSSAFQVVWWKYVLHPQQNTFVS